MSVRACVAVASAVLFLSSCGEGGGARVAAWEDALAGETAWDTLSPARAAADEPVAGLDPRAVEEFVGANRYQCTVTNYSLTETPREFVAIDPDQSVVWLGNLVQGASHYTVGSLREIGIRERAPLKISIDLLRGDNTRTVENPSLTTVQSAIGDLVEQAVASGHRAASTASYDWKMAHSSEEAALRLGFAGEYMGASASASLESETHGDEKSYYAYFIQRAFTVSMELPTRPSDLVTLALTPARLSELEAAGALGSDNPPLYVASVTYGRVLIYKMTSSDEERRVGAAIAASYSGTFDAEGYAEAELRRTLSEARIQISTFGGDQAALDRLIRTGKLQEYFAEDTALTSMQPISFELRTVSDNRIAAITRTTEYEERACSDATPPIGMRLAVQLNRVRINTDCDAGPNQGDLFGQFSLQAAGEPISLWTRARGAEIKVQSGNDLSLGGVRREIDVMNGQSARLTGYIRDADTGANGADDTVGSWSFNVSPNGREQNTRGSGNCLSGSSNQAVLYYNVTKLRDIYP